MVSVYTRSERWNKLVFLLPTLWVLSLIFLIPREDMRIAMRSGFGLLYIPFFSLFSAQFQLILTGPVLTSVQGYGITQVPLARAEIKVVKRGWRLRWPRGKSWTTLTFRTPPSFQAEVERSIALAQEADPDTLPLTERARQPR